MSSAECLCFMETRGLPAFSSSPAFLCLFAQSLFVARNKLLVWMFGRLLFVIVETLAVQLHTEQRTVAVGFSLIDDMSCRWSFSVLSVDVLQLRCCAQPAFASIAWDGLAFIGVVFVIFSLDCFFKWNSLVAGLCSIKNWFLQSILLVLSVFYEAPFQRSPPSGDNTVQSINVDCQSLCAGSLYNSVWLRFLWT